jgi:hypothetical protein
METTVRIAQVILLLIGSMALGVVSCGIGLLFLAALIIPSKPGGDNWGAAIVMFPAFGCGATLGAIGGLAWSLRWVTQRGMDTWKPKTWVGVILGFAAGLPIAIGLLHRLPGPNWAADLGRYWTGVCILAAAPATLGGILATITSGSGKGREARRRRRRPLLHKR